MFETFVTERCFGGERKKSKPKCTTPPIIIWKCVLTFREALHKTTFSFHDRNSIGLTHFLFFIQMNEMSSNELFTTIFIQCVYNTQNISKNDIWIIANQIEFDHRLRSIWMSNEFQFLIIFSISSLRQHNQQQDQIYFYEIYVSFMIDILYV